MVINWIIPPGNHNDYNAVSGSVWIRCLQMIKPFKKLGWESVINQYDEKTDLVIFIRRQDNQSQFILQNLRRLMVKTVFLTGVNYYERTGNLTKVDRSVSLDQIKNCISMTYNSNAVLVSSQFLKERASRYNPNVYYIPDSIDMHHFLFKKNAHDYDKDELILVWCGVSVKAWVLNILKDAIKDLPLRLLVISDKKPDLDVPFEFEKFDYHTFPQTILRGDICVCPRVLDNSYDMGHSNFKINVFLAQGIPAFVSPQESYEEVFQIGSEKRPIGQIIEQPSDWKKMFIKALDNRDTLKKASFNAIEKVRPYSTERVLEQYEKMFKQLLGDN